MGLAFVATAAFCLWIILYALGVKSFDGFLLAMIIIATAAGTKALIARFGGPDPRD